MRKYVQVVLVVLSVFSLVTLLVYRHEYNKLRYVLEVLNFFGTPNATVTGACLSQNQEIWTPPAWQRISNNINIYSAYWDEFQDRDVVRAVAVGTVTENIQYGCYLWFDGVENPLQGEVSYAPIPITSKNQLKDLKLLGKLTKNRGYSFLCRMKEMPAVPTAVTFYKIGTFDAKQTYMPMTLVHAVSGRESKSPESTAMCILPTDAKQATKELFAEFLSYHLSVDVQDFILYGNQHLWQGISKEPSLKGRVHLLQWNYPFASDGEVMRTVAQADCELRTRGIWENAVALYPNQLVVPKFHKNIGKIFLEADASKKFSRFNLPVLIFCLEYRNDQTTTQDMPIVFQKTQYIQPRVNLSVSVIRGWGTASQKINKDIAVVHWYTPCNPLDDEIFGKANPKFDHSILRFNTETLLQNVKKFKTVL